jgi:diguanylate cyclase (GGDEF)-like protein
MGSANFHGLEATGMRKVLCLLEPLRQSPTGAVIYRQVERMLDDLIDDQQSIERAYLALINQLLEAYAGHLRVGSPLQLQVKLLQARLQPPLTTADMATLRDYVEQHASQIESLGQLDSESFRHALEPLLAAFGDVEGDVEKETPADAGSIVSAGQEPQPLAELVPEEISGPVEATTLAPAVFATPSAGEPVPAEEPLAQPTGTEDLVDEEFAETIEPDRYTGPYSGLGTGTPIAGEAEAADEDTEAESQVDAAYRTHLDSKRRDILKLQSTLAEQVLGTIAQNEEFGVLLEVVLGELRQAGDGRELEDLRWTLIREIEKLTKGHHELAEQLDRTHHYLQLIESDSRQLSDELTRVRLLSLTDELTGLPNRRAFLRRIEDEVARVQRYGFPLSLSLIDLDHFKQVNDKYGHAGGDEVLQMYSKNILSIFRHHDLVARYGGEEFAVLLPNTDAEGALRALTKVKNRAGETRWQNNGDMIPVPTFSSGVSLYKPGETASAFIERADKALYRAKRMGRNRIEMDATYQSDADESVAKEDVRSHN